MPLGKETTACHNTPRAWHISSTLGCGLENKSAISSPRQKYSKLAPCNIETQWQRQILKSCDGKLLSGRLLCDDNGVESGTAKKLIARNEKLQALVSESNA